MVAVVGGGLAGLAAALDLVDGGADVTLYEARPTLGGAVQTLPRREGDPEPPPDNGQHIALGCFTEYLAFLERIGSAGGVRREPLDLPVIAEDGSVAHVRAGALSLLRYRHLPLRDRIGVAVSAKRLGGSGPRSRNGVAFGELLRGLGSSQLAIDRFWDVFVRPALNLPAEEAGADFGTFTVRTALLGEKGASDLVLPVAPLGELHGAAAGRALEEAGAEIRLDARVTSIADGSVSVESGAPESCDAIVVALPPAESARLLGEPAPKLHDSPIVSVHLLVDPPVLEFELAALLDSPAHWVFDRGRLMRQEPLTGQYLTVVSSGAPELLEIRGRGLVDVVAAALRERLGPTEVRWSRVSREPRATFAATPGANAQRRGPETAKPNVVRAGAWTQTGWPATMEGAVRSGRAAARLLLDRVPSTA
jgi:squalene-associated FAD-dependent desaturase